MSLRDELERSNARIAEIDAELAKVKNRAAELREERARLVAERQEIRAFLNAKEATP